MIARSGCGKRLYHCHSESFISSAGPAEGRVLSTNSPDVLAPAAQVAALRLGAVRRHPASFRYSCRQFPARSKRGGVDQGLPAARSRTEEMLQSRVVRVYLRFVKNRLWR